MCQDIKDCILRGDIGRWASHLHLASAYANTMLLEWFQHNFCRREICSVEVEMERLSQGTYCMITCVIQIFYQTGYRFHETVTFYIDPIRKQIIKSCRFITHHPFFKALGRAPVCRKSCREFAVKRRTGGITRSLTGCWMGMRKRAAIKYIPGRCTALRLAERAIPKLNVPCCSVARCRCNPIWLLIFFTGREKRPVVRSNESIIGWSATVKPTCISRKRKTPGKANLWFHGSVWRNAPICTGKRKSTGRMQHIYVVFLRSAFSAADSPA